MQPRHPLLNVLQGLYFANMASKSANYCAATPDSPTGLLLGTAVCVDFTRLMIAVLFSWVVYVCDPGCCNLLLV
jgi:hypothetical protein